LTKTQKANFRMSSAWKNFRVKMKKKASCFDWITKQPLTKTWNLHHLDLRSANYKDISDPERFIPLNENTHEFIHWLYTLWSKDKKVLTRIEFVLCQMKDFSSDKMHYEEDKNE